MGWRYRKSFKIAPGVRINLSRSGVSTTIGPRGASINVGKRGVYANTSIPGTGISARTRIGGSPRALRGARSASPPPSPASTGSGGGVLVALLGLLVFGMCMSALDHSGSGSGSPNAALSSVASLPPNTETFYLHTSTNVRQEPDRRATVVRTLPRGMAVRFGPKDEHGWAQYYGPDDQPAGYLYRASDAVRRSPPPDPPGSTWASTTRSTKRRHHVDNGYYTGPRGGCYTYSASGRKRYVDHSYCY